MNYTPPGNSEAKRLHVRISKALEALDASGPGADAPKHERQQHERMMSVRNYEYRTDVFDRDDIDLLHAYERFLPDPLVISPKHIRTAVTALRKDGHEVTFPVLTLAHINHVPAFDAAFQSLSGDELAEMFVGRGATQFYPDVMNLRYVHLTATDQVREFMTGNLIRIGSTMTNQRIMQFTELKSLVEQMYLAYENGIPAVIAEGTL